MIPVLSREQIRALDRHAIEKCSVPSLVLMENAGRGAAEAIARELAGAGSSRLLVVCGGGNNGGDGFVVARRLLASGRDVRVFLVASKQKLSGDARANHDAWCGIGGTVTEIAGDGDLPKIEAALGELGDADVVVDALLGTGLDRAVEGRLASVIQRINTATARRIALDIPSGLDANTGAVLGTAVRAHVTITFGHLKLGLFSSNGAEHAGHVHLVDIGVPAALHLAIGHAAVVVESADVAAALGPRSLATHKGSAGHVLVVAGSVGKTGASLLVARGALRAGAGLATIATFPEAADTLDRRVFEEMTARIDRDRLEQSLDEQLERADVVAIGPGLGHDPDARRAVDHVVLGWNGTKIVDADAITHFRGRASELRRAPGSLVLTPHPGEMGRLLDRSSADVEHDRFAAIARAVELTGAVVVLKGPRTLIGAPDQVPVVNRAAAPVLATAGSGDVLTGIVAGFACSLEPREAAFAAVHVHGLSALHWSKRTGADRGMVAREIADGVPEVLASLAANPETLTV
jgi:ADP-dependent NAD(P)H-hydrate dehydratase / NAD(P)H-hydrate epimerase